MCRICAPILGWTKPHGEAQCPLSQASCCPNCGRGTHFAAHCPKQQKAAPTMPPSTPPPSPKEETIIMTDTLKEYESYLTLYKVDFTDVYDRTKGNIREYKAQLLNLVKLTTAANGKILTRPLPPCTTLPMPPVVEAAATAKKVKVRRGKDSA